MFAWNRRHLYTRTYKFTHTYISEICMYVIVTCMGISRMQMKYINLHYLMLYIIDLLSHSERLL